MVFNNAWHETLSEQLNVFRLTQPKKVLVIEDDQSLASIYRMALEELCPGVEIDWTCSAEEAVKIICQPRDEVRGSPYNLVVVDIFLEGEMTGLDFWKICKEFYPAVPVVMASTLPLAVYLSILQDQDQYPPYLSKPFTYNECREVLSEFV